MATIIDRLVVELGLDPKNFTAGQKKLVDELRKTKEEARKQAKESEDAATKVLNGIQTVQRRVLTLVTGGAFGAMLNQILQTNAATSRLASNLDQSVQKVDQWQKAIRLAGGTAEEAAGAFTTFFNAFQGFQSGADPSKFVQIMAMLGRLSSETGVAINPREKDLDKLFTQIGTAIGVVGQSDRGRAFYLAQQLGFGPGAAGLFASGKMKEMLGRAAASPGLDPASGKAAERYAQATEELMQAFQSMAIALTPAVEMMTKGIEILSRQLGAQDKGEPTDFLPGAGFGEWQRKRAIRGYNFVKRALGFGGGDVPLPPRDPRGRGALRTKGDIGQGGLNVGTLALAHALQESVPELKEFTSGHRSGDSGKHGSGLALDFTLTDKAKYAEVSAALRKRFENMGINATVLDEHNHPLLGRTTGSHIHVQFPNAAEAGKYREMMGGAASGAGGGSGGNTTTSSAVTIGNITVNTQATDAEGIARDLKPAIERTAFAMLANNGLA